MAASPSGKTRTAAVGTTPPARRPGSAAQQDRRKRILRATVTLASRGGYDAVQMRDVAESAGVALGTLYRYFPSKTHLLVSALAQELDRTRLRTATLSLTGETPYERMLFILDRINRGLRKDPQLTEAMTRAFVFADASVAAEVEAVGQAIDAMFSRAFTDDIPAQRRHDLARVISDVWLAGLITWVTQRASAADVAAHLEMAVGLLLGEPDR